MTKTDILADAKGPGKDGRPLCALNFFTTEHTELLLFISVCSVVNNAMRNTKPYPEHNGRPYFPGP